MARKHRYGRVIINHAGTRRIFENRQSELEKERIAALATAEKISLIAGPFYKLASRKEEEYERIERLLKTAKGNTTKRAKLELADAFSATPKGERALRIRQTIKKLEAMPRFSALPSSEKEYYRIVSVGLIREQVMQSKKNARAKKRN